MDWLKALAPTAAALLGGPLAGMAVKFLGDAIGLSGATEETLVGILQSGSMSPEQVAAVKKADNDLKVRLKELDIKIDEIAAADRANAREMLISTRSWVPALLSISTVAGFFILLGGAAAGYFQLTGSDVMMLLLGVLARETASVYQFWLGSSSGSQHKTDMLRK